VEGDGLGSAEEENSENNNEEAREACGYLWRKWETPKKMKKSLDKT